MISPSIINEKALCVRSWKVTPPAIIDSQEEFFISGTRSDGSPLLAKYRMVEPGKVEGAELVQEYTITPLEVNP